MDQVGAGSTWPCYGKRQQQRASCFLTLLRNDLNLSDVVHFTTPDLSCLATNQVSVSCVLHVDTDFRLDKITRELRQTRA